MMTPNGHTYGWLPYEDGHTIGRQGSEGGTIIRDDEDQRGARITLERDCLHVPYAITCGIYGWMVHTRFIADEPTAVDAFETMRSALGELLALMPDVDADDLGAQSDRLMKAIGAFVERFA